MKPPVNGTPVGPSPTEDPAREIAEAVYQLSFEEGDEAWGDLADDDRDNLTELARYYIAAHLTWMTAQGIRTVPPGATLRPKTEAEAMAMLQAAKDWFDAQKRKGKLIGEGPAKRKLILPGMH